MSFFSNSEMRRALVLAAASWEGTPFRPHANIKGAGVDCVHLAISIYHESGFTFEITPPRYTMDGGQHLALSQFKTWLDASGKFQQAIPPAEIGDALLFRMGGVEHHVGIKVTDSVFVHSIRRHGVIQSNLEDPTWKRRLTVIYRPI